MSADAPSATPKKVKPRYRGISHLLAFFATCGAGSMLVVMAAPGLPTLAAAVFVGALVWQLGFSAFYHVPMWPLRVRARLRRVDHASIFILIAGTYTPVCLFALPRATAQALLAGVWTGAAVGFLIALLWENRPHFVMAGLCLALGWAAVLYAPELYQALSAANLSLLLLGGLFYSGGAIVYALRRPNPAPAVFGYLEVFHVLVLLASACHFAAVVSLVRQVG